MAQLKLKIKLFKFDIWQFITGLSRLDESNRQLRRFSWKRLEF